jgi:hypothetical protein
MNLKRIGVFGFATFASLAAGACSSGAPSTPTGTSSQAVDTVETSALKGTVQLGVETPFDVSVAPNAACTLHAPGAQAASDPSQRVYGDEHGVLHLSAKPDSNEGATASVVIDCVAPDGTPSTRSVELQAVKEPGTLGAELRAAGQTVGGAAPFVRPALSGDPLAPTQAELAAQGYPPRPDPGAASGAYARWLRAVSQPATRVSSVERPEKKHYPAGQAADAKGFGTGTSSTWAGSVASGNQTQRFDMVTGFYDVPSVTLPSGQSYASSALWVGIDGWYNYTNDIIQCGTEQAIYSFGAFGNIAFYSAWTEYFPANPQYLSMSVGAGDEIFTEAWNGDPSGAVDLDGHTAWFEVDDETRGTYYFGSTGQPGGTFYWGMTAEWILERGPNTATSAPPLADYNRAIMQNASAAFSGSYFQPMGNFNPFAVDMQNPAGSSNYLTLAGPEAPETVYYFWAGAE